MPYNALWPHPGRSGSDPAEWMPVTTEAAGFRKYSGHRSTNGAQSAARRRSYRRVVYAEMARLPEGPAPANCVHRPTVADETIAKLRQRSSKLATVAAFLAFLIPTAFADQIVQTYLAGKVDAPPNTQLAQHGPTVTPVYGTETFAGRTTNTTFSTNFGTNGVIVGSFSGSYTISAANQYGGAGGSGNFITTPTGTGTNVKLTHTATIPGVNYFGLAISALNAGNTVVLKRAGATLITYGPADLIKALGACPNVNNAYCGNPGPGANTGLNSGEQYAFVNFFDLNGYFDEIVLTENGGGFENDNFTTGYVDTNYIFGTSTSVPEPGSLPIALAGLFGLAAAVQLTRRRPGSIAAPAGMAGVAAA